MLKFKYTKRLRQINNELRREIHDLKATIESLKKEIRELREVPKSIDIGPTITIFIKASKIKARDYDTTVTFVEEE